MIDWQIVLIFLCLGSGVVTLWIASLSWRRRSVNGAKEFTALLLVGSTWSFLYMAELASSNPELMTVFALLKQVPIIWISVPWILFALRFFVRQQVDQPYSPIMRRVAIAFSIIPTISTILLFTTDLYIVSRILTESFGVNVVEFTFGPVAFVLLAQAYTLTFVGTILLLIAAAKFFREKRQRPFILLLLIFLPAINGVIPALGNINIDITPLTFSITAIVLGVVLLQLRIFDLLPVAYDRVVADMVDGVMIVDNERRILDMNQAMEKLTQVKLAQVYDQRVLDAFPDMTHISEKHDDEVAFEDEVQLGDRFIELRVSPLRDTTKRTKGRLMIFHDVTERRKMAQERQSSERRYRTLFSRATDAILLLGFQNEQIIDANTAASYMLGYSHDELIAMKMPDLQAEDQRREISTTNPRFEIVMKHKAGNSIPCELSLAPIKDGDKTLFLAVIRDITERKAVEEDLNTRLTQLQVLRQVSDEIADTLDVDHVLMISLDAALRLSAGHAGFIALLNEHNVMAVKTIGSYTRNVNLQDSVLQAAIQEQNGIYIPDIRASDDPGDHLPQSQARIVVPLISRYNVIGLLNLETTISDRFSEEVFEFMQILADRIAVAMDNARLYKQAQLQIDELRELYEQVSYLEGIKTDMIRIAAHDLRNPLSVLLGYLTVMELDIDDFTEEYQDFILSMLRAVRRMNVMIDDILSLERIERMATQDVGEPFDLLPSVHEAVQEFSKQAKQKQITLHYSPPEETDTVNVLGDAPQIYEALTNLISNAIKYTPEGGTVTVTLDLSEVGTVTYKVTDTGIGIPQNQQDRLFQPFFRVKDEQTRKVQGTGLGLHLVKNIVERHKGAMIFKSVYGEGSTFGFRVPLHTENNVPA